MPKWADEAEALEAELRDTRASQAPAESARERATRHLSEEALQSHNRAGNMGPYSFPSLINEFRRAPNSALVTWCLVIWADRTLPEQVALIKESSSKEKDANSPVDLLDVVSRRARVAFAIAEHFRALLILADAERARDTELFHLEMAESRGRGK